MKVHVGYSFHSHFLYHTWSYLEVRHLLHDQKLTPIGRRSPEVCVTFCMLEVNLRVKLQSQFSGIIHFKLWTLLELKIVNFCDTLKQNHLFIRGSQCKLRSCKQHVNIFNVFLHKTTVGKLRRNDSIDG